MRVCILTYSFGTRDGWGRTSYEFSRALLKHNAQVTVLTNFRAKNAKLDGVLISACLTSYYNRWKKLILIIIDYFRALKYIKESDIILSLIEPLAPLAMLYSIFNKKPYFIIAHGTFTIEPFKIWHLAWLYRLAFRKAEIIYCVAEFTQKELLKIIPLKNTIIRFNAISTDQFCQSQIKLEKNNQRIILSVGVLKHRKGYHISIPAIAEVSKIIPNLKYYIVGKKTDLIYYNQLKDLIKKYQLENIVEIITDADDKKLAQLYQNCDVFLLTPVKEKTHFEGFGMVYIEAGACGKPVIGTHDCGAQEAIIENQTGLLVPQNDIKETAKALIKILKNPELASKLGQAGKIWAEKFSYNYQIPNYLKDFKNALKNK